MEFFPKIDTLFQRGDDFNVDLTRHRRPEFADIRTWLVNEKLDGSNISIAAKRENGIVELEWRGRTERAQFHKEAVAHLEQRIKDWTVPVAKIMSDNDLAEIEFFGELLGPKIQKGSIYTDTVTTVFYDIRVGGKYWLPWDAVLGYSQTLGYETPWYAKMHVDDIIRVTREGFEAIYSYNDTGKGGPSEGLILKTNIPLQNNAGKRLIAKLKTVDFTH